MFVSIHLTAFGMDIKQEHKVSYADRQCVPDQTALGLGLLVIYIQLKL